MGATKITESGTTPMVSGLVMASSTDISIAPPSDTGQNGGLYGSLLLGGVGVEPEPFVLSWAYNIGLGQWSTLYACDSNEDFYYPWLVYNGPNVGVPPPWFIATVPEPSSEYLLGFGAMCGSVYVLGHKRRAPRTATTA
jgi:hypothetical protein